MITVKLQGGLGNQMFQYAVGRALAEKNRDRLVLDLTFLLDRTPRESFVFRDYDLGIFPNIRAEFTWLSKMARRLPIEGLYLRASNFIRRVKTKLGVQRYAGEPDRSFYAEVLELKGNVYLDGYWQSEKYFSASERVIRSEFAFGRVSDPKAEALRQQILGAESVCLNVRRGDYVSLPSSIQAHGFVGVSYYNEGIKEVAGRIKNPHFYVFSDEIDWCRENLKLEYAHTFVGHDYAGEKFGCYLMLMSSCKHFLIANSSFGWWAAWLSRNREKVVVAPKRWARNEQDHRKDLIPATWIRV